MNQLKNNTLPPCVTCYHANRAPMGYVEACGYKAISMMDKFGRCVNAAIYGKCKDYKAQNTHL